MSILGHRVVLHPIGRIGPARVPEPVVGRGDLPDDLAAGQDVEVTEIGVVAEAVILVRDVPPAHDRYLSVDDEGLVVHAVVDPGKIVEIRDEPTDRTLGSLGERVEYADTDVGMRLRRDPVIRGIGQEHVVDQEPYLNAPVRCLENSPEHQRARVILVPDEVLRVEMLRGAIDQRQPPAQGLRSRVDRDEPVGRLAGGGAIDRFPYGHSARRRLTVLGFELSLGELRRAARERN